MRQVGRLQRLKYVRISTDNGLGASEKQSVHDRQCMYVCNVTLRRVRATIVAVEKQ